MNPDKTWCDLATEWAEEDAFEAQRQRFAAKLDAEAREAGLTRSAVFTLWKGRGMAAAQAAA